MPLSPDRIEKERLMMLIKQRRRHALELPNSEAAQQLLNHAAEQVLPQATTPSPWLR